jgi:hypothetical protein
MVKHGARGKVTERRRKRRYQVSGISPQEKHPSPRRKRGSGRKYQLFGEPEKLIFTT